VGGQGGRVVDAPDARAGLGSLAVGEPSRLAFEGVTKRFGDVVAVDDLTLEVEPGESLVLLGPSGCGKSTALRIMAGLETPTSGVVRIGDRVVNDVDPKDRDVAMVFQSYALYPHLNVRRNIEFPLRSRHVPADERDRLVAVTAKSLGLEDLLDRKPAQLSGGQRQRVALARAIVRHPRAFLMDEPLSNLDAQLRTEMRAELAELHLRLGVTVLYVTHDQVEAMTMGQRIAILRNGVLQQVDAPRTVHDRPANAFVAGFIGSPPMNILAGRVDTTGATPAVAVDGGTIPLGPAAADALRRRGLPDVTVGVRPENLRADPDGTLQVTVALAEYLGHEQHLGCRLPGGGLLTVRLTGTRSVLVAGDPVTLTVEGEPHLFDPADGTRIDV
jgi:multiple sugar transport system ATP-binding protein